MKIEIVLSAAVAVFMGTVLVWLSIILVDVEHWYSYAANYGGTTSYPQVLPVVYNAAAVPGGAQ